MEAAIKQTEKTIKGIPPEATWLDPETPLGQAYWEALQHVGLWTKANHEAIHQRFLEATSSQKIWSLGNAHNFIWKSQDTQGDYYLHGKGATPAWEDSQGRPLLGLIPLNMAQPILLVAGKNNPKFLGFAPHGAGRNLTRGAIPENQNGSRTIPVGRSLGGNPTAGLYYGRRLSELF